MARNTTTRRTRARDYEAVPDMLTILDGYVAKLRAQSTSTRSVGR